MRKNIFNRSTLTAICLSLVMSACSDSFLDIQPQDKPGSDNFLLSSTYKCNFLGADNKQ